MPIPGRSEAAQTLRATRLRSPPPTTDRNPIRERALHVTLGQAERLAKASEQVVGWLTSDGLLGYGNLNHKSPALDRNGPCPHAVEPRLVEWPWNVEDDVHGHVGGMTLPGSS